MNVHGFSLPNNQTWKNPNIHQQVNRLTNGAYPYNGTICNNIKEWPTDINNNMHESQNHRAEWKKPDKKAYMLSYFIYLKF